jgi:hypothetical protein
MMQTETYVLMVIDDLARKVTHHVRAAKGIPSGVYDLPAMKAINALAETYPEFYAAWAARARDADRD